MKHVESGEAIGFNEQRRFQLASVFKIPVLVTLYKQIHLGRISLDDRIMFEQKMKTFGSGLMNDMKPGLNISIQDLQLLMMARSDNAATDILYRLVTPEAIQAYMKELGLNDTTISYDTRQLILAYLGLDPSKPPATWEQFLDYAKKLTKGDRWGVGIIGARQEGIFMRFNPWPWGAGGDYLAPDEKRSALDKSEFLEGFKFYVELFTKHKVVPPGVIEQGAQEVRTQLAHGKVAMIITLPAAPGIVQAINPKINVREVMALAPVPVGKKKVTSTWFSMRVISAFTKNPEAAWKVYRTWMDTESQMRNFKIAGVLSTRLDIKNSPEVKADKFAQVFAAQTPYVKLEPLAPEWPKIGDAMITAIQEALTGVKTPEQALKDAHAATNRALGVQ
jgi:hypothetical protein